MVVLSQYYEESYATDLIDDDPAGVGYLLKERVGDVDAFVDAIRRVAGGGTALDPEVVERMLGRRRAGGRSTTSPRASGTCCRRWPRGARTWGSPSSSW